MSPDNTEQTELVGIWPCGRGTESYRGGFPNGFLRRVDRNIVSLYNYDVIFPFGGSTKSQENWTVNDIRKDQPTGPNDEPLKADTGHDATDLPDEWEESFGVVLSDPPYSSEWSEELYDLDYAAPSDHFTEAIRVCKPGGWILILDQLIYATDWNRTEYEIERETPIGVTTGPKMRIRALNIFRKPGETRGVSDW